MQEDFKIHYKEKFFIPNLKTKYRFIFIIFTIQKMKIEYWKHKRAIFLFFLLGFTYSVVLNCTTLNASERSNLLSWLRANRWDKIIEQYEQGKRTARTTLEHYALAKALYVVNHNKKPPTNEAWLRPLQLLLRTISIRCSKAREEKQFIQCLNKKRIESIKTPLEKLSLRFAAKIARKNKMSGLQLRALELIELKLDPFHSSEIFAHRLHLLVNKENAISRAGSLLDRQKELSELTPYALYQAGFLMLRLKKKQTALRHWHRAFSHPDCETWLKKDIIRDLKKFFGATLAGKGSRENTLLLATFATDLPKKNLGALRRKIDLRKLVVPNQKPSIVKGYGLYLIAINRQREFMDLATSNQNTLKKNLHILIHWSNTLREKRRYSWILKLSETFPQQKTQSIRYYRNILDAHEKKTKRLGLVYFEELLQFINRNPYAIQEQDKLIKFLVKQKNGRVKSYASQIYWRKAMQELPKHNSSGRFYYWSKRFYQDKGDLPTVKKIYETVYSLAPGSYYIRAFWPKSVVDPALSLKARANWRKTVKNRQSYLAWFSQYGKLPAKELAKYKRSKYFDYKAVQLATKIKTTRYTEGNEIVNVLLDVGQWPEAIQLYKKLYYRTLEREDYYIQLIHLGIKKKYLNLQVYYARALLNEFQVSLDPFSIPNSLLRILYPRPYLSLVTKYTAQYDIDSAVVYAIMRQESLFLEGAVSRSNARGLMQIIPKTGDWLRGLLKISKKNLFDPEYNIHLGSYYFSRLLRSYENDFNWATIAYNGGPGNLSRWKKQHYKKDDFYLFLESLPNMESRNYCRIVNKNYHDYQLLKEFR